MGALATLKGIYDYFNVGVRKAVLLSDFYNLAAAIPDMQRVRRVPSLTYVSSTVVRIQANAGAPVGLLMSGFPNILHPGQFVNGGLSDGWYREVTANTDLTITSNLWGTEKSQQWYIIYAIAAAADTAFTLQAMPLMRFSSQASQVITLRNNNNSANIGYGFTTDQLAGGVLYVLSGTSQGLTAAITHNNNDNSTGGTITYGGSALTMSQGDWFVVLPPGTNFRFIGCIWNDGSSNIQVFYQDGDAVRWGVDIALATGTGTKEYVNAAPPLATRLVITNPSGGTVLNSISATTNTGQAYWLPAIETSGTPIDSWYVGGSLECPILACKIYQNASMSGRYAREFKYPAGVLG